MRILLGVLSLLLFSVMACGSGSDGPKSDVRADVDAADDRAELVHALDTNDFAPAADVSNTVDQQEPMADLVHAAPDLLCDSQDTSNLDTHDTENVSTDVPGEVVCASNCDGKECGDDGCGGQCGSCDDSLDCTSDVCDGETCKHAASPVFCIIDALCVPSGTLAPGNVCRACDPAASGTEWTAVWDGKECGAEKVCHSGQCCTPVENCAGKDCGDDGCGGQCGECVDGLVCSNDGLCVDPCEGYECGQNAFGDSCGDCSNDLACVNGKCVTSCIDQCAGKSPQGCYCDIVCAHYGDCCGDVCLVCPQHLYCDCYDECVPDEQCGWTTCGGACGTCSAVEEVCTAGQCNQSTGTECDDGNAEPWDGCTNGQLSETAVSDATTVNDSFPAPVVCAGQVFVAFQGHEGNPVERNIYVRRFDLAASPVGAPTPVSVQPGLLTSPTLACGMDSFLAVAWTEYGTFGEQDQRIRLSFLKTDDLGVMAAHILQTENPESGGIGYPQLAASETGNVVIAYSSKAKSGQSYGPDALVYEVYLRSYDIVGQPVAGETLVNTDTKGDQSMPAVAWLHDDMFVVVWNASETDVSLDPDDNGVSAQTINSDGDLVGLPFLLNSLTDGGQLMASLARAG